MRGFPWLCMRGSLDSLLQVLKNNTALKAKNMKKFIIGAAMGLTASAAMASDLETVTERSSYYFGLDLGSNLVQQIGSERIDIEAVIMGLEDGLAEAEPRISVDEIREAVMALQQELEAEIEEESASLREPGEEFLADNAERDGVQVTASGLQYEVLSQGDSDVSPSESDTVRVHYHGTLVDGTVFDSSEERGEPVEFPLDGVIPGWTEGVQLMSEGDRYRLYIPSDLAYRDQSVGNIPPYSVLIFEIELLEVL